MNEILITILNALVPILITGLTAFLTWLGTKIKNYYDEKTKNETVKNIAEHTVKYVEQVFTDLKGVEKLEKAKNVAIDWLKDKNIKISDAELTILLESFVNGLKTDK